MTTDTDHATLTASLAGYARRLHAVIGDQHQVTSPLGAWLLLALCGPATRGADREALAEVLGCEVTAAARIAAGLLSSPHPLVAAAAAVWTRDGAPLTDAFPAWQSGLPAAVQTGALPGQAGLDAWARDHTFGLIERFPVQIGPGADLILASALATRVSWEVPFALAPASALGPGSPWSRQLRQVLRTPAAGTASDGAHRQFVAVTPEAGDVAVHLARARGGLLVASVAADASVPPAAVLTAAQALACRWATGAAVQRRPLAELPLGEAPLWLVREAPVPPGQAGDGVTAVLPAWSARSDIPLTDPSLGFGPALRALAPAPWDAVQAAMARYSRTGFEAAAVTAAIRMSAVAAPAGRRRVAELRFGHPYAVVAVAVDERPESASGSAAPGPWPGVPVFSAWVTDPEDATDGGPAGPQPDETS